MLKDGKGRHGKRRERAVAVLLVLCVAVVGFWEVMSRRSERPFDPYAVTSEDFDGFVPRSSVWSVDRLPVSSSPTEPNILAFGVRPEGEQGPIGNAGPVLTRLVHGYNMPDCMRIKQYEVGLIRDYGEDTPQRAQGARRDAEAAGMPVGTPGTTAEREIVPHHGQPTSHVPPPTSHVSRPAVQVWRLTSSAGDASIWVTSMLRVADFGDTDIDVRSMAFPRVGIPDDPNWVPRGLTWRSLMHPVRNLKAFMRSKWNASRCDPWVFLGLKQPTWASEEVLTLVSAWKGRPVGSDEEAAVAAYVEQAHGMLYLELRQWRAESGEMRGAED
jgi:hypothetical protein